MNPKPTLFRYRVRTWCAPHDNANDPIPRWVSYCRDRRDLIHAVRRESKRDGFHSLNVTDLMPKEATR